MAEHSEAEARRWIARIASAAIGVAMILLVVSRSVAPTADGVLAHFVDARGGRAALDAIHSARLFGTISFGEGPGSPLEVLIARPPRIRTEFALGDKAMVQGYDGHVAWMSSGDSARVLDPDLAKNVAACADIDGPLIDYAAKGDRVSLRGREAAGDHEAYKIEVQLASGLTDTYWIDAASWLQTKWQGARVADGKPVVYESRFSDYRDVHGVKFAFRIESSTVGRSGSQVIRLDSVQVNVPVTDADFAMPTAKGKRS